MKKKINIFLLKRIVLNQKFYILTDNFLEVENTIKVSKKQLKFFTFTQQNLEVKYPLNLKIFLNFTLLLDFFNSLQKKNLKQKLSIWFIRIFNFLSKTEIFLKKFYYLNFLKFFKQKKYIQFLKVNKN